MTTSSSIEKSSKPENTRLTTLPIAIDNGDDGRFMLHGTSTSPRSTAVSGKGPNTKDILSQICKSDILQSLVKELKHDFETGIKNDLEQGLAGEFAERVTENAMPGILASARGTIRWLLEQVTNESLIEGLIPKLAPDIKTTIKTELRNEFNSKAGEYMRSIVKEDFIKGQKGELVAILQDTLRLGEKHTLATELKAEAMSFIRSESAEKEITWISQLDQHECILDKRKAKMLGHLEDIAWLRSAFEKQNAEIVGLRAKIAGHEQWLGACEAQFRDMQAKLVSNDSKRESHQKNRQAIQSLLEMLARQE